MAQNPLVSDQKEMGARFIAEFSKAIPVESAFWLTEDDSDRTYLYIASAQINDSNKRDSYGEVLRVAAAMGDDAIDPFEVKLIGSDEPLARSVMEMRRREPSTTARLCRGRYLGGYGIKDLFVYPTPMEAPRPEAPITQKSP